MTLVYSSEVIHVPKCRARNSPERNANLYSDVETSRSFSRWRKRKGARIKEARVKRYAAITSDGASIWAKRTKIDEVEAAKIPSPNARTGGIRALLRSFPFGADVGPGCLIDTVSLDKF